MLEVGFNFENLIINNGIGEFKLTNNSRIMRNINNSSFGDNVNFQGDEVTQSKIISIESNQLEEAFIELFSYIKNLEENMMKEQAEINAEILKESVEKDDKSKGGKFLKFLVGSLGLIEPLVIIAQLSGIPLPNTPSV